MAEALAAIADRDSVFVENCAELISKYIYAFPGSKCDWYVFHKPVSEDTRSSLRG